MRTLRIIVALSAAGALVPLAALAIGSGTAGGPPSDRLWHAIVAVESGGDTTAYNPHDGATGMAQIRTVCVEDANRIARRRGLDERFTAADRSDPKATR